MSIKSSQGEKNWVLRRLYLTKSPVVTLKVIFDFVAAKYEFLIASIFLFIEAHQTQ
jgi:hypothetical protein